MLTPFCIKTNPRENRFFAAKWTIGEKKGTHNVKFSTENLTKIIILHARASGQRHRKHVGLQQPARAVVGDVAHDQPRRHYGKAEVICYREQGFQLVENAWNNFRQVAFWKITTFCHRQFGAIFQVFIVSSSSTLCMRRMFILVLPHNENKLHPIYRTIKSQDNFTERSQYERLFPAFVLHYKQKQLTLQSNKQRDY